MPPRLRGKADQLTPLWYDALNSALGIEVRITGRDRQSVASSLYRARDLAYDTDLRSISIVFPPGDESLIWLVRRATESRRHAP